MPVCWRMGSLTCAVFLCVICSNLLWQPVSSQDLEDTSQLPRIYSLHIQSDIKFRFATTLVTSRVTNPSEIAREVEFEVTLPNEAYISNFTLEIEGEVYPGEIKEKEKAKKEYEKAKKKGQSAGHVVARPRETNRFKVQINVASLSKVTFNLTYQELLKCQKGMYEHTIYIDPGQIVDDLKVDVVIQESRDITTVIVPPLRNDLLTDVDITRPNEVAIVQRANSRSAYIQYYPSVEQQKARSEQGIAGQFVIKYEIEREMDAGDVLVVNGYFVHFFAPRGMDPIPKDALFILDVSTSMRGDKLAQLKKAMKMILNDLHEGDRFNMMEFSSGISYWRKGEMVHATRTNVAAAKQHVQNMKTSGWTNINRAVTSGVNYLNDLEDDAGRSPIVIFLTDGEATTGEKSNAKILNNIKARNLFDVPIFSLAFGKNADYEFVKKVAAQNNGVGRRIYEDSDAALQISGFYDEISTVMLKNVTFQYLDDTVDDASLTKSSFNTYFDGSEMIIAGRMEDLDTKVLSLAVAANGVDGIVELTLASEVDEVPTEHLTRLTQPEDYEKITEKIWAYLTIKQLMDSLVTQSDPVEKQKVKQKVLEMSLKYNFVTPLTSMVVTKPESSDLIDLEEEEHVEVSPRMHDTVSMQNRFISSSSGSSGGGNRGGYSRLSGGGKQLSRREPIQPKIMSRKEPNKDIMKKWRKGKGNNQVKRGMLLSRRKPIQPKIMSMKEPNKDIMKKRRKGKGNNKVKRAGGDPHFMIRMDGVTHPMCFDIPSQSGEVYCILKDPEARIQINAEIIAGTMHNKNTGQLKTYIGEIVVIAEHFWLEIAPQTILLNGDILSWNTTEPVNVTGGEIYITHEHRILQIQVDNSIKILIKRHVSNNPTRINFLNFYMDKEELLSERSTGILGEFIKKKIILVKSVQRKRRQIGMFQVEEPKHKRFRAILIQRSDVIEHLVDQCWCVDCKTKSLLDHAPMYYLVKDKFMLYNITGM